MARKQLLSHFLCTGGFSMRISTPVLDTKLLVVPIGVPTIFGDHFQ